MRLLFFLFLGTSAFAQLPTSGSLSIKTAAGSGRSIAQEVDGNVSGSKSLTTLSVTAGKSASHSMLEFRGYEKPLTPPGAPGGPMSAFVGSPGGGIYVGWNPPSGGGEVDHYRLEWQEAEPGDNPRPSGWHFYSNYSSTTYTVTIPNSVLNTGSAYFFRVRSENSAGNSAYIQSGSVVYE